MIVNEMNNPKVSIIIATYNSEMTLRTALESVHSQEFQDWECIIVDGMSKDDTINIVKEYETNDSRFLHISEPDKGIYDAFNKGWKMAKGEWVHYLGDDDRLTPNGIKDLLQVANLDSVEIVSGHCYIEKLDGSLKENRSYGFFGCHQGKLTRRSTLERFDGFNEQYPVLADKELLLRMENAGVKIVNVNTFVAYFSMTGMSQSMSGLWKRTKEFSKVYRENSIKHPYIKSFKYLCLSFLSITYRKVRSIFKLSAKRI